MRIDYASCLVLLFEICTFAPAYVQGQVAEGEITEVSDCAYTLVVVGPSVFRSAVIYQVTFENTLPEIIGFKSYYVEGTCTNGYRTTTTRDFDVLGGDSFTASMSHAGESLEQPPVTCDVDLVSAVDDVVIDSVVVECTPAAPAPTPSTPAPTTDGGGGDGATPAPTTDGGGGDGATPAPTTDGGGGDGATPAPTADGGGGDGVTPAPTTEEEDTFLGLGFSNTVLGIAIGVPILLCVFLSSSSAAIFLFRDSLFGGGEENGKDGNGNGDELQSTADALEGFPRASPYDPNLFSGHVEILDGNYAPDANPRYRGRFQDQGFG